MSNKKVWFITGASRGMGADFAKAALAAGHSVVASGRSSDRVSQALGDSSEFLPVKLDVTVRADAESAVLAALDRFGRIDVLVNNAASFYAGYFEELTSEQFEQQLASSLFGPMNVTRAVLPVMRKQRSGHISFVCVFGGHFGGLRLRKCLCRVQVRPRGLDRGIPAGRDRPVRHQHDGRQSRLLPNRAAHRAVDQLRGRLNQRLRRSASPVDRVLEGPERQTDRRPLETCAGAADYQQPRTPAAPFHRWR